MALTLPQALQRMPQSVMSGIAKTVITTDQMAALIPFEPVESDSYRFVREGSLPVGGAFINDLGVTSEESTGTDDRVTVEFRRVVGNIDIDELANTMSGGMQQGMQTQKKVKATWRSVSAKFVTGGRVTSHTITPAAGSPGAAIGATATYSPSLDSDRRGPAGIKYTHTGTLWAFRAPGDPDYGPAVAVAANATVTLFSYNASKWIRVTITVASATADGEVHIRFNSTTNEFDGINVLVDPSQQVLSVGTDGDDYSFAILDDLLDRVKVRNNPAFIMNGKLLMKHFAACRNLGGVTPDYVEIPSVMGKSVVPSYRGVPLIVNDNILNTESKGASTTLSSIYLASLDSDEGLFIACPSFGGQRALGDVDPRSVPVLGFRIQDIGLLEGKDARRTRVSWYGAPVLRSPLALARKQQVKTA
jgi:hypothetical protein